MKMQTSELQGSALDWAVARLECFDNGDWMPDYCTDWAAGGPIIEREHIELEWSGQDWIAVTRADEEFFGFTPLIAAMRCYVASKLGDEVEIPEEVK